MSAQSPDTSASLLERARAGVDASAWNALVERSSPVLHVWLAATGLQPADRDDVK